MKHDEYIQKALRTESKIDNVILNKAEILNVLKMYISLTDHLDSLKKKIFYQNDKKYQKNKLVHLKNIKMDSEKLIQAYENNEFEDGVVDINQRVLHGLLGVITESGEIASALANYIIDKETLDAVNIQEEVIGDISWYTAILCDELELNWEQGMRNNIEKLKIRYPEKFTTENAMDRDLLKERTELEKVV